MSGASEHLTPSFRVAFVRLFAVRLLGTISVRFAYPFLPTIADGLDADLAAAPHVVVFGVAMFFLALGRLSFDISLNAWVGDRVAFERRGRVSGIAELAWSGSFVIGGPRLRPDRGRSPTGGCPTCCRR